MADLILPRMTIKTDTLVSCPHCGGAISLPQAVGDTMRRRLTPTEVRIVETLIETAESNREIARRLGTTEQVIKNYLSKVYRKVGIHGRIALVLACRNDIFRAGLQPNRLT